MSTVSAQVVPGSPKWLNRRSYHYQSSPPQCDDLKEMNAAPSKEGAFNDFQKKSSGGGGVISPELENVGMIVKQECDEDAFVEEIRDRSAGSRPTTTMTNFRQKSEPMAREEDSEESPPQMYEGYGRRRVAEDGRLSDGSPDTRDYKRYAREIASKWAPSSLAGNHGMTNAQLMWERTYGNEEGRLGPTSGRTLNLTGLGLEPQDSDADSESDDGASYDSRYSPSEAAAAAASRDQNPGSRDLVGNSRSLAYSSLSGQHPSQFRSPGKTSAVDLNNDRDDPYRYRTIPPSSSGAPSERHPLSELIQRYSTAGMSPRHPFSSGKIAGNAGDRDPMAVGADVFRSRPSSGNVGNFSLGDSQTTTWQCHVCNFIGKC